MRVNPRSIVKLVRVGNSRGSSQPRGLASTRDFWHPAIREMNDAAAACAFPIKRPSFPWHTHIYSLLPREFPLRRNYLYPALPFMREENVASTAAPKKRVYACVCVPRDGIFIASGCMLPVTLTNTSNLLHPRALVSLLSSLWESGVKSYTGLDSRSYVRRTQLRRETIKRAWNCERKFLPEFSPIDFTDV